MNAPEKLKYDRSTQDVGNIVLLEHFNCCIDDQRLAVLFYVVGLGATRDPYLFPGMENIWLNFGRTQVHMPSRAVPPKAERLRGTAGFVVPSLEELAKRLEHAGKEMKDIKLKNALKLLHDQLHLTYSVDGGEVLMLTSPSSNRGKLITVAYNVADLVVPVRGGADKGLTLGPDGTVATKPGAPTNPGDSPTPVPVRPWVKWEPQRPQGAGTRRRPTPRCQAGLPPRIRVSGRAPVRRARPRRSGSPRRDSEPGRPHPQASGPRRMRTRRRGRRG